MHEVWQFLTHESPLHVVMSSELARVSVVVADPTEAKTPYDSAKPNPPPVKPDKLISAHSGRLTGSEWRGATGAACEPPC